MRPSTMPARLITIVIAVIVTPLAAGLLATGGSTWLFAYAQTAMTSIDLGPLVVPILLQTVGILLLLLVVLTGIWSSAGLIAVGVLALFPLLCALFPALVLEAYRFGTGFVPREWVEGLSHGLPLILFPVLGAMGLVLALVRRRSAPSGANLTAVAFIAAPVLLLGGGLLLSWGLGRGRRIAIQNLDYAFAPDAAAVILVGVLLIIAGVFATRWSAYALLLPALALLVVNALVLVPRVLLPMISFLPIEGSSVLLTILLLGGGSATALLYLGFTVVLLRVRRQAATAPVAEANIPPTAYAPSNPPAAPPTSAPHPAAPPAGPYAPPSPRPAPPAPYPPTAPPAPYPPTAAPPAPPPGA